MSDGPYTRRWHIWACDDPSCKEVHGENQGEVHDEEVVPLSDAERMRERVAESEAATERICQRLWKVHDDRDRMREALEWMADTTRAESPDVLSWAIKAHDKARAALNPEQGK